jgi:hypothetical protein
MPCFLVSCWKIEPGSTFESFRVFHVCFSLSVAVFALRLPKENALRLGRLLEHDMDALLPGFLLEDRSRLNL